MPSVYFEGTRGKYRVDYIETVDIENNKSSFYVSGVYFASTYGYSTSFYCDGSVWINDSEYIVINNNLKGVGTGVQSKDVYYLIANSSGNTLNFNRDASGKASITIALKGRSGSSFNDFNMICLDTSCNSYVRQTQTVPLETILRESTLKATNGELGSTTSLTVTKRNDDFTHTITYTCGNKSGTVCTKKTETVVQFTPPLTLAETNLTGTSVNIYYTIKTYSGDTLIGSKTAYAAYTIPASVKPSLKTGWASVAAYNTGTDVEELSVCVQGISKAKITFDDSKIDLSKAYGATIVKRKITYSGISYETTSSGDYTTGVLTADGTITFKCYAYDTRGRYATQSISIPVKSYFRPVLSNVQIYRCKEDGTASNSGTYMYIAATANYASLDGLNEATTEVYYKSSVTGQYVQLDYDPEQTIYGDGLLLPNASYIVRIILQDNFNGVTQYEQVIVSQAVAFSIMEGGKGVAFGKYADEEKVLALPEGWRIKIGSTYLSEDKIPQ